MEIFRGLFASKNEPSETSGDISDDKPVFQETTEARFFPVSTTDTITKFRKGRKIFRSKRRNESKNLPFVNMASFDFLTNDKDKETAKTVAYAAMSALGTTGNVVRITAFEEEYENRIVVCLGGTPIVGTDQIDRIRNSAVGRIRNIIWSVYVPPFARMKSSFDGLNRQDSWQVHNEDEQPQTLGIETSVSIYIIRKDKVSDEKLLGELASSESFRNAKRSRRDGTK